MINLFLAGLFLGITCNALDDGEYHWAGFYGVFTLVNLLAAHLILK